MENDVYTRLACCKKYKKFLVGDLIVANYVPQFLQETVASMAVNSIETGKVK